MLSLHLQDDTHIRLIPVREGTHNAPRTPRYQVVQDGEREPLAHIVKRLVSRPTVCGYSRTTKMKWVLDYPDAPDIHQTEWDTRKAAFQRLRDWLREDD